MIYNITNFIYASQSLFFKVAIQLITLIWIVSILKPVTAQTNEDNWNTNLKIIVGTKQLNKDNWGFVAGQMVYGIEADFRFNKWPVNILTGFTLSRDEKIKLGLKNVGQTNEFNIGVRKEWGKSIKLHLSGGCSVINAHVEGLAGNNSGTGVGVMADSGFYIPIQNHFSIGYLYRYSFVQSDIADISAKLGGGVSVLSVGYHW